MTRDRVRRVILAVALLALVLASVVVAASVFTSDPTPYQGEEVFGVHDGPEVVLVAEGETDLNLEDMFANDELDIQTSEGQLTLGGDPGVSARLNVDDIEGEQTALSDLSGGTNWLYIDPADKQRLDVRGDVSAVQFGDVALDDGEADLEIVGSSGGTADIRLYDLPADEQIVLYDRNTGDLLVDEQTDGSGTLDTDFELTSANQQIEVRTADSFDAPTLTDPEPEGEVTEIPEELSINVSDGVYPIEVTFEFEGEEIHTTEIEEGGTVTTPVDVTDLGEYEWSVTAEDAIGQTTTRDVAFETPRELTIREEHDPETIVDDATVTLRFFTSDGTIAIERETEDGTLDMEGLPNSDFVVFIQSDEYYDRRAYLGSIFEQEELYVLSETEFPRGENDAVQSRFTYTDLTGEFPRADTTIQVQRAIDIDGDGTSEWRTVAGDFWGAGGEFQTVLEHGERYRLFVQNQETGETNMVGTHIPTEDLAYEIRTSGLTQEAADSTGIYANADLDVEHSVIEYVYNDPTNETEELQVRVISREDDTIMHEETVGGPLGPYQGVVELNETQVEQDWVVELESDQHRSAVPVGAGTIGLPAPVPGWVMAFLMSMAVTFVGALYGPRTAVLGAWAMVFVASGAAMFGWAFSWPAVIVATLVAVGATFYGKVMP